MARGISEHSKLAKGTALHATMTKIRNHRFRHRLIKWPGLPQVIIYVTGRSYWPPFKFRVGRYAWYRFAQRTRSDGVFLSGNDSPDGRDEHWVLVKGRIWKVDR